MNADNLEAGRETDERVMAVFDWFIFTPERFPGVTELHDCEDDDSRYPPVRCWADYLDGDYLDGDGDGYYMKVEDDGFSPSSSIADAMKLLDRISDIAIAAGVILCANVNGCNGYGWGCCVMGQWDDIASNPEWATGGSITKVICQAVLMYGEREKAWQAAKESA